jgi:hypothetical protein
MKINISIKFFLFFLLNILSSFSSYAQKESYNWYFGKFAGIDFNGKVPVATTIGGMDADEACTSISDKDGYLLFYTNSVQLFDKTYQIMPNGNNLKGHASTTQGALIVPFPDHDSLYYLFTLEDEGGSFYYSIVNMKLNNGKGDVIMKNTLVLDSCTEKLTATKHSNGKDYWILIHKWNTNEFYSYLLTSSGLQSIPVISAVGVVHNFIPIGYMKLSFDAKRMAVANEQGGTLELFDFNNTTGVVSNQLWLYKGSSAFGMFEHPYGLEFSMDNKLLYVSWSKFIFHSIFDYYYSIQISQFDIGGVYDSSTIVNSKVDILAYRPPDNSISQGALQMGPDHRIYASVYNRDYIAVIQDPNVKGVGCNFILNGLSLYNGRTVLGLPNILTSLLVCDTSSSVTGKTLCYGVQSILGNYTNKSVDYLWQDGSTGSSYNVSQAGMYTVKMGKWGCYQTDTFNVNYKPKINVDLGQDVNLCYGQIMELIIKEDSASYLWQDGSQISSKIISVPGKYSVTVTKDNCKAQSDIDISYRLCCDQLLLPNLITLNQDGKNDELFIDKLPEGSTTLQVFNSWGDRVYEDGKFNRYWKPENLSDGVYYYILKDNNSEESCKSWIQLIKD